MGRGIELGVAAVAAGDGGQVHVVLEVVDAQSGIEEEGAETVAHLYIRAVRLPPVIERGIEVVLPEERLLGQVPVADAVVAVLAVGSILIAKLEQAGGPVVELVGEGAVAVPMVLRLIASRTFLPCSVLVEHVALGVFLREAVVAEAVGEADLVAPLVELPSVVDGCLEEVLRQLIAVVTV